LLSSDSPLNLKGRFFKWFYKILDDKNTFVKQTKTLPFWQGFLILISA